MSFLQQEENELTWIESLRGILRGKICRVSGQLLTVIHSLDTNQEKVGGLLLLAARLSSSVGGELTLVKPLHDLHFLPRLPIIDQLPFVLLTQVFDNLNGSVYAPLAHSRTYGVDLKFCSAHSFLQAFRQRTSLLEPILS
jgi:hypothetical protein